MASDMYQKYLPLDVRLKRTSKILTIGRTSETYVYQNPERTYRFGTKAEVGVGMRLVDLGHAQCFSDHMADGIDRWSTWSWHLQLLNPKKSW